MRGDAFLGRWLVTEYVFDGAGTFIGANCQQRDLERVNGERIRVTQRCQPDAALAQHPLAEFAGEWVFELVIQGGARRYLGPDVLGGAVAWGDGAMAGRGLWPRFGHNFVSWSVMISSQRQLTGGRLFDAGTCIAHVVGVGQMRSPEEDSAPYPSLDLAAQPGALSSVWHGTRTRFAATGDCMGEEPLSRTYHAAGWREGNWQVTWIARGTRLVVTGDGLSAVARHLGPLFELEGVLTNGAQVSLFEVVDAATQTLVGIHRVTVDENLQRVAVIRLCAAAEGE